MKVIKSEERIIWETKTAKGYEYPFEIKNIDCAVVEIKGRHPLSGWYRNTQVDEMIYCKKGTGKIVFKDGSYDLKEDDAVFIEKNRWYFWDEMTDGVFVPMCNPAWSPSQGENKTIIDLVYKKIEKKDSDQLFKLIDVVLNNLDNPDYFIPYEEWEYESMFDDKNYAPLYGAYDGDKLVGMAQLYVSQEMLADFKKDFGLDSNIQVAELGGNLVLPEYRGLGITTNLQKLELEIAKERGFDYLISMAHPDNIGSCKTLEKVGLQFVNKQKLTNGFLRNLYMLKLK